MRGVTLRSNRAGNGGGGIANHGDLTLTNVTLSSTGSDVYGSLYNLAGTATLLNVTVYGGTSPGLYTGGIYNAGGTVSLEKSIIASGGTYPNCTGAITSLGRNLDSSDGECGYDAGLGDLKNTDPMLAPLGDYGGATSTHALLFGSPAVDAAGDVGCPPTDQRGFGRPVDGDDDGAAFCDIGAFELQPTARLSVSKAGSGSGRVISTPVGIACGDDCLGVYPIGQLVVLAAGADQNSIFVGWSGAGGGCSGLGFCALAMDANAAVTAVFVAQTTTTTTTLPPLQEECGNCIDDDGDGLTDYESPACCSASSDLAITWSRLRPGKAGRRAGRLRLAARLAAGPWADVNPRSETITVQLRGATGEFLCATLARDGWKRKGGGFRYEGADGAASASLKSVVLGRPRRGRIPFRAVARELDLASFTGVSLTATVGTGDQCAIATIPLTRKGSRLVYP
jgi:hypothetical protein